MRTWRADILVFILLFAAPFALWTQSSERIDLQGEWQFRPADGNELLPAQVPGTVHTDLFANKLIPDPFEGLNEPTLQWIEARDWEYIKTFQISNTQLRHAKAALVFDGLDTYADVYLNGTWLAKCDNMHRRWEIPCKAQLVLGSNELKLVFHSPMQEALPAYNASPFPLSSGNDAAPQKVSPYVRKAAYHFGWDFAPRFVTAGIWRPVTLRLWDHARITDLYARPLQLKPQIAKVGTSVMLDVNSSGSYVIALFQAGRQVASKRAFLKPGLREVQLVHHIKDPQFWWPTGMGKPYRYDLKAVIVRNSDTLDAAQQKLGLRNIRLVQEKDGIGTSFYFSVNDFHPQGGPLFIKGANYVPADVFLPRAAERQIQLLEAAEAVGMNMLRVWGGGVYADEAFYEWCDAHGILVWQDLAFACMMYPLEGAFRENALSEVEDNLLRLRGHPSLALWCGNNEIDVAWHNWGWQQEFHYSEEFSEKLWREYQDFFQRDVPALMKKWNPDRPWITTSPLSNWGKDENFNHHNMHYWGVWHGTDSLDGFSKYVPRFMSEYGFQSWPSAATLRHYTQPSDWAIDSKVILNRQKSYKGNAPILKFMKALYGEPKNFDSFLYLSQLLQRDAMTLAIEAHRMKSPHCMGTLYWQLNDCWPGASWSTIDYDGVWKAAHYALKRLYAPVLVTGAVKHDSLFVQIASDSALRNVHLDVRLRSFDGEIMGEKILKPTITKGAATYLAMPLSQLGGGLGPRKMMIEISLARDRRAIASDLVFFAAAKDLVLPAPDMRYEVWQTGDHYEVSFLSKALVKDVALTLDGLDATFSDNFFDLVPGVEKTVVVKAVGIKNADELFARMVVRDLTKVLR